jgi:hypothetical protein
MSGEEKVKLISHDGETLEVIKHTQEVISFLRLTKALQLNQF